jgi:hypothetical protein
VYFLDETDLVAKYTRALMQITGPYSYTKREIENAESQLKAFRQTENKMEMEK